MTRRLAAARTRATVTTTRCMDPSIPFHHRLRVEVRVAIVQCQLFLPVGIDGVGRFGRSGRSPSGAYHVSMTSFWISVTVLAVIHRSLRRIHGPGWSIRERWRRLATAAGDPAAPIRAVAVPPRRTPGCRSSRGCRKSAGPHRLRHVSRQARGPRRRARVGRRSRTAPSGGRRCGRSEVVLHADGYGPVLEAAERHLTREGCHAVRPQSQAHSRVRARARRPEQQRVTPEVANARAPSRHPARTVVPRMSLSSSNRVYRSMDSRNGSRLEAWYASAMASYSAM